MSETWCWSESDDSEQWGHAGATREEALAYAEENPGEVDCGYIAPAVKIEVTEAAAYILDIDDILERMDESNDEYAAFDDPTFILKDESPEGKLAAKDALNAAIVAWAAVYVDAQGRSLVQSHKSEKVPLPKDPA